MASPEDWTCKQVGDWLKENGFEKYKKLFSEDHKIDGKALMTFSEDDLKQPPLQLSVLGDIKRLIILIRKLQSQCNSSNNFKVSQSTSPLRRQYLDRSESISEYEDIQPDEVQFPAKHGRVSRNLDPEIWKTALSFLYMMSVLLMTSFVMVIVHDRVPDTTKYPPLPDIFLDNVPFIPWAFKACEIIAVILGSTWIVILVFHKHRFILLRRNFSMLGTIFLLRSVCMLITSLSVPGVHLKCEGKLYGDIYARLRRTFEIWTGLGMTISGVRTCGDYMFSGHTVCVTMLNFLITEYSPRSFHFVHTSAWVANMFALFLILAAHEHYSIDVFVAFYITSRMFLYYHTLANNRLHMLNDKKRTRVWFPLFSFFESKCDGMVPNEYEWPLSWEKIRNIIAWIKQSNGTSTTKKKKKK